MEEIPVGIPEGIPGTNHWRNNKIQTRKKSKRDSWRNFLRNHRKIYWKAGENILTKIKGEIIVKFFKKFQENTYRLSRLREKWKSISRITIKREERVFFEKKWLQFLEEKTVSVYATRFRRFLAGSLLFNANCRPWAWVRLRSEDSLREVRCLMRKVNSEDVRFRRRDSENSLSEVRFSAWKVNSARGRG